MNIPRFDAALAPKSLRSAAELAELAEECGFSGVWTSETQHDPFLPLALAAENSQQLELGTAVAIALARSPATVAYTAWDLAQASQGRFILGLGSQVRAHIRRRFGMEWPSSPLAKMREFVGALRAFWRCWQHGEELAFKGDYYRLGLMTPFFNPGPIEHPEIPIYLAGVNTGSIKLAGQVADGLHGHPLHTERYLREVVRPTLAAGAESADREPSAVKLSVTVFVFSDQAEQAEVRRQIAFYASTPNYRPVLALHGWGQVADELSQLVRAGRWQDMPALISDDMLEAFAVHGQGEQLGQALRQRYQGLADRITLYRPLELGTADNWRPIIKGFRS